MTSNDDHVPRIAYEKAVADAVRLGEEVQTFVYHISHDMQTPVRHLDNFSTLLIKNCTAQLDERGLEYVHLLREASLRLQMQIEALMDYSRVLTGTQRVESVCLNTLLDNASRALQSEISSSGATIVSGDLPRVYGEPAQLTQLLIHLMDNALKFRSPSKPPVVRINAEHRATATYLSIKDNGVGFEQRLSEDIFLVFRQLHPFGRHPGIGMGLAVCRRIVEQHGGEIHASSNPGEGTSVFVTLPNQTDERPKAVD